MIHYHGTPISPRAELAKMAGRSFCVSFAAPRDADWCQSHGQSVMWDNGAFSFYTQARETNWPAFYQWLEPRLGGACWAVVPDVIEGTEAENLALIRQWPHRKDTAGIVWHLHEDISHLLRLTELGFGRVCFGSSGGYWQVGSIAWERRVDEAFNALARNGQIPWVHMLRGLAMAGSRWPFASADSVNVGRNFKDTNTCPDAMARRIDAVQCPIQWSARPEQKGLFDAA
ncbi:glycosyltransferase [Salipiger thiooxidans]|uniref:glycosyltransferase n=1 Tax=Salipiger thiooxidans TaxID=282683 RepID=UPI001A8DFF62|nr:glycosyltransferase [Salipiger thiooxidans]MBN8189503.1 glycosyltransferase [Salipiger thiooxidans]